MNKKEFTMDALSDEELDCVVGGGVDPKVVGETIRKFWDFVKNRKTNGTPFKMVKTLAKTIWDFITGANKPGKVVPGIDFTKLNKDAY